MTESIDLLESMFAKTHRLMLETTADELDNVTPCPEFTVRDLFNHMCAWIRVFDGAVNERPLDFDPTTFTLESEWETPFSVSAKSIVSGLRERGVDRPMTMTTDPMPGSFIFDMLMMEYIGHGLDISAATKRTHTFSEAEAKAALDAAARILQPQYRGNADGMFHTIVEVPSDASAVDRFIGFLGRDPSWRAE